MQPRRSGNIASLIGELWLPSAYWPACTNGRNQELDQGLAAAYPNGIDVYYDNVAGSVLAAVLQHINAGARIPPALLPACRVSLVVGQAFGTGFLALGSL